ncbi:regulatory protein RecX [Yinghuangia seranimata]|nr:regulatory protein RecX [Yinghuangia seranimata]MDI2128607.1 regulatory protein RecX [Yinghuangia seranimata]
MTERPKAATRRRRGSDDGTGLGGPGSATADPGTGEYADPAAPAARYARGRAERGDAPAAGDTDGDFDTPPDTGRRGGRRNRRGRSRDSDASSDGAPRERRQRRIGPAQIDPDADPEAAARAICLRLLTGQPRTRAQLADALRRRGVPDEVADHVLGRFAEVRLIDDAAFANAWVDTRHTGRGLARRALARELRQRGVAPSLVDEAVERLDPEQESETARALVDRRLAATRHLDRQVRLRRLAGMLARKGYSEGLALRVVRTALDEDAAAHPPPDDDEAWPYGDYDDTPEPPED